MQRLAIAEGFVNGRVEAVQDSQLELIRALEEVLEVAKREHNVRHAGAGRRVQAFARGVVRQTALHLLRGQDVVPEFGAAACNDCSFRRSAPRSGTETSGCASLRRRKAGARLRSFPQIAPDPGCHPREQVPHATAADSCGWEPVPEQRGHEHDRPLHSLGLVDGHDPHGVGVGVLVVLPALGVGVLGADTEGSRRTIRTSRGLGLVVDRPRSPR